MLSRKQVWRKTSCKTARSTNYLLSFLFQENSWNNLLNHSSSYASTVSSSFNDVNSIQFSEVESAPSEKSVADNHNHNDHDVENQSSTTSTPSALISSLSSNKIPKKKRKVTFSNLVKVCLIPTRQEMIHLAGDMYWSCVECELFKKEAFQEIQAYSTFMDCSCKEAISLLFQPGTHTLRGKEVIPIDLDETPLPTGSSRIHRSDSTTFDLASRMTALELNIVIAS